MALYRDDGQKRAAVTNTPDGLSFFIENEPMKLMYGFGLKDNNELVVFDGSKEVPIREWMDRERGEHKADTT